MDTEFVRSGHIRVCYRKYKLVCSEFQGTIEKKFFAAVIRYTLAKT